jgi:hypothetical protein
VSIAMPSGSPPSCPSRAASSAPSIRSS